MSEVNHSDRAHSSIGASSSKRWFACPASVPLSEGVESKTSVYAEEGTSAHELAEYCLEEELDAVHGIGLEFNGFKVTTEMAEAVQVYLDAVRSRMSEDCELIIEERFDLKDIHPDAFGSNDAFILDHVRGKLTVLDYKHGQGIPVEVTGNTQLLYYALGGIQGYDNIFEVDLVIVQPRCDHPDGPVRVWETDVEELMAFKDQLKEATQRVDKAREVARQNPPSVYDYAESGDHCHFCPASGFCNKLRSKSYEVAQVSFDDETINPPSPESLTAEEISKVLRHSDILEKWVKAVRAHAHQAVEMGEEIPGMKLVKRRANRKWKDEAEASESLGMLIEDEKLYKRTLITPAQAEKILGKGTVDNLVTVPDNGTQLVKDTDKRPSVVSAVELFND